MSPLEIFAVFTFISVMLKLLGADAPDQNSGS